MRKWSWKWSGKKRWFWKKDFEVKWSACSFDKKISKWSKVKLALFLPSLRSEVKWSVGSQVRHFGGFWSIFDRFWPPKPKFFARFARGQLLSHQCVLSLIPRRGKLHGFYALLNLGALDCKRMLLFTIEIALPQTPRKRCSCKGAYS